MAEDGLRLCSFSLWPYILFHPSSGHLCSQPHSVLPKFQSCLSLPSVANSVKSVLEARQKEPSSPYVKSTGFPPVSLHPSSHGGSELMGLEIMSSIQKCLEVEADPRRRGVSEWAELTWLIGCKHTHTLTNWLTSRADFLLLQPSLSNVLSVSRD